jgi:alpha-tubulin suppressor-like RCC1 family protein
MSRLIALVLIGIGALASAAFAPPFPQVSSGHGITCVRDFTGDLYCMGVNPYFTTQVPQGQEWAEVRVGWLHGCARRADRTVECWGWNGDGQTDVSPSKYLDVAVGDLHSCGLTDTYQIVCWGDNRWGQSQSPVASGPFVQVVAGSFFTCGLASNRHAICWGANDAGQLDAPDAQFERITAGAQHTCGLTEMGEIICWGRSIAALDARTHKGEWVAMPPDREIKQSIPFIDVVAGGQHTCALTLEGRAICWGDNTYGQINVPEGERFVELSAGWHHTCGVTHNYAVVCWGQDD